MFLEYELVLIINDYHFAILPYSKEESQIIPIEGLHGIFNLNLLQDPSALFVQNVDKAIAEGNVELIVYKNRCKKVGGLLSKGLNSNFFEILGVHEADFVVHIIKKDGIF